MQDQFHDVLRKKIDQYVHLVFRITKKFPKDERFGVTSQLRRAALSVMLNYIEGYARKRNKVYLNFLETSYGSLKESEYLLVFSKEEDYIDKGDKDDLAKASNLANEIGAMLWKTIQFKSE
jgi:four helix bundle protein